MTGNRSILLGKPRRETWEEHSSAWVWANKNKKKKEEESLYAHCSTHYAVGMLDKQLAAQKQSSQMEGVSGCESREECLCTRWQSSLVVKRAKRKRGVQWKEKNRPDFDTYVKFKSDKFFLPLLRSSTWYLVSPLKKWIISFFLNFQVTQD